MWLFRLPSIVYLIVAPCLLAFGVMMFFQDRATEADKAKARSHKPPAEVPIEQYDPAKNKADFNEVVLLAQLDVETMLEVVKTKRGSERSRTIVARLYPANAKDKAKPAPGVLVTEQALSDTELQSMFVAMGAVGPVLKINGSENGIGLHSGAVNEAFRDGPAVAPNAIYIEPFVGGRAASLVARDDSGIFLGLGFFAALLVGGFGWYQRKNEQSAREAEAYAVA